MTCSDFCAENKKHSFVMWKVEHWSLDTEIGGEIEGDQIRDTTM
jgi:hypothetical protein